LPAAYELIERAPNFQVYGIGQIKVCQLLVDYFLYLVFSEVAEDQFCIIKKVLKDGQLLKQKVILWNEPNKTLQPVPVEIEMIIIDGDLTPVKL